MNTLRVATIVRRHWLVLWRAPHRWFEIAVWPVMDVVLWGSLGVFVSRQDAASRAATPYLLAGLVLFWVLVQVQFTAATGVMEETWTRNLLNVLTTPVTELEYVAGLAVLGLGKIALAMASLTTATLALYGFDVSEVGWAVVPIAAVLATCGFALAFVVIGLILRFGQSAEVLCWALNYIVMSISGVFFPADALPGAVQPLSKALPTTQAFAALREVLDGEPLPLDRLAWSALGAVVATVAGLGFAARMLHTFRRRGFVTRYS